jgi:hypothetical protein
MARKNYTDEFRLRTVDLYESTPAVTLKGIAADLGVSRGAMKEWVGDVPGVCRATRVAGGEGREAGGGADGIPRRGPQARHGTRHFPSGGEVFRQGDELVTRFQFVEDHKGGRGRGAGCEDPPLSQTSRAGSALVWWAGTSPLRRRTVPMSATSLICPSLTERTSVLSTVIDLCSRKLPGWTMAEHMRCELIEDALKAAWRERGSLQGAVFHSDHGSVYTSKDSARLCAGLGVRQSMGAIGSSADSTLAESFNTTLKRELLNDAPTLPDQDSAYRAVFRWANRCNTRRRHSAICNFSPNSYDTTTSATLTRAA